MHVPGPGPFAQGTPDPGALLTCCTRLAVLYLQLGVVSFPVGKLYHNGRLLGSYLKGPTAPEIAEELMARASEIMSNEPDRRRGGLPAKDEM